MSLNKFTFNIIYYLILIFICKELNAATSVGNYGPFKVEYDRCEICAGPKSNNVTNYTVELRKDGYDYFLHFNLSLLQNCHVSEIKITIYTLKENKKSILLNYKLNDPCHHFAVASVMDTYLHANRCVVKKGIYEVKINISDVASMFFGTSFFYGEFLVKALLLSKEGNMLCIMLNSIYIKKTK